MKKLLGILSVLFISQLCCAVAQEGSIQLKDNLNEKFTPAAESTIDNKGDVVAPLETKLKPLNNSLKNNIAAKTTNVNLKPETKPVKDQIQTATNNEFVLNEKVLNLLLSPKEQWRPEGIIYQETQRSIDVLNPKKNVNTNSNYPGLRGPNQLMVYTPLYGLRTGTNEFGTEAIIEDNMVVQLNGADSIIPKNGFVISGHGAAKKWITQNIQVGSKVYIDYATNSLRVFLTPESLLFAAKEKIKEVNGLIEYYRNIDVLYHDEKANEYLNSAKDELRKAERKPEKTQSYINDAMKNLDSAIKNAIPYIKNEVKGVWVRPVETTEFQIERTVERLKDSGITDIFLETYFHGKTIFPSEYLKENGVIAQREEFIGFDPLEVWIREAHKRNMKLHIWFESFYVGNDNPQTTPNHVLNVYPSWANKRLMNYDSVDPVPSLSEHNGYFLDPSNIQVRTYLYGILEEILTKYKPDGVNLDYIRYPQTVDSSFSNYAQMNWGYTQNARETFYSMYGVDPIDIKFGTPSWDKWALYRQNQITEFLVSVRNLTKSHNVILTAVIFPDLQKCLTTKMQNWRIWSMNNYVDGLTPLILTCDKNTADLLLRDVMRNTSPYTNIYPGIFVTFMGGSMDDLLMQIHKTREYKTRGLVLFDYAHLNNHYVDALKTRVFNKSYVDREIRIKLPPEATNTRPVIKKKKLWRKNNGNN